MGSGEVVSALCAICCCLFPPLVLQSVGFFTPKWVSNDTCNSIGLIYSCCSGSDNSTCANTNGSHELNVRVLGLHATAFTVMFLAVFGSCFESCCGKDDDDMGWCGVIGGCCIILYPLAGLLSFIGCMLLVSDYSGSQLGYSFYLCLAAGLLVIVITIILCVVVCRALKNEGDTESGGGYAPRSSDTEAGAVQSYEGYGGAAPYGGQRFGAQHAVIEQRAVVHDPETGSFFMFMRRINITHIVGAIRHGDD